jgi:hypothetical protein
LKYYLKELYDKYDLLLKYKEQILKLNYSINELKYLDGMIFNHRMILNEFENYVFQITLRNHSNYRLKEIIHGEKNLVDLLFFPEEYVLNLISEDSAGILLRDTIVFKAIDNKLYVFSPISRIQVGLTYKGDKWQKFK